MTQGEFRDSLPWCEKCKGKPILKYDPGCSFTECVYKREGCPMTAAAPDDELDELSRRINAKNKTEGS